MWLVIGIDIWLVTDTNMWLDRGTHMWLVTVTNMWLVTDTNTWLVTYIHMWFVTSTFILSQARTCHCLYCIAATQLLNGDRGFYLNNLDTKVEK